MMARDEPQKSAGIISSAIDLETILAASQHLTYDKVPGLQLLSNALTALRLGDFE